MKTKSTIFLFSLSVIIALFIISSETEASLKVYKLKLQSYHSLSTVMGSKALANDIERLSDGRIKVTVFAGGELVSSDQILQAVKAGTLEMGQSMGFYFSELDIGRIESALPMAWASAEEAEMLYVEYGLSSLIAEAYKKQGVHYIGPVYNVSNALLTKKPVRSLDDLRKMKIRSSGGTLKMLSKLGVQTVHLRPEEMYLALSTGQIDGITYGSALEYKLMKLYEVAPYYCTTYLFNPGVDCVIINSGIWNELPDDLKAAIEFATYRARWKYYTLMRKGELSVKEEIFKGKLTSLPAEDIVKLTKVAAEVWDEEASKSPRNAKAVKMLKEMNLTLGRLKELEKSK
jgi:TRAP-type C4-dicarboxylate transport system substrate-binding protein